MFWFFSAYLLLCYYYYITFYYNIKTHTSIFATQSFLVLAKAGGPAEFLHYFHRFLVFFSRNLISLNPPTLHSVFRVLINCARENIICVFSANFNWVSELNSISDLCMIFVPKHKEGWCLFFCALLEQHIERNNHTHSRLLLLWQLRIIS